MAKEYNIAGRQGRCAACGREFQPQEEFVALLKESGEEFRREDYCSSCWEAQPVREGPQTIGTWRSVVPRPQEKRKRFVDNDVLVQFFQRLEGTDDPARVSFRFVLALVLMRKKLLVYDRSTRLPSGRDVWTMHFKGSDQVHEVLDPHMDEQKIAEVSQHLQQILPSEAEA